MREYTPQEAAVLAGAKLGAVQKAITSGSVEARRKRGRRLLTRDSVFAIAVASGAPSRWKIPLPDVKAAVVKILRTPDLDRVALGKGGAFMICPQSIVREVRTRLDLYDRARDELIVRDPRILGGTPVIKGTRLNVHAVAGRLEHGERVEDLLKDYPTLTREQIEAAHLYARANPLRGRPGGRPWARKKNRSS